MSVLVTGSGGFIGSHLVERLLEAGAAVRALDLDQKRLAHVADQPRLELVTGTLTDAALQEEAVAGVDLVYHLASAHLDVSLGEDVYRAVNVEGTLALARAAHAAGVARFVHVSTNGVVGEIVAPPVDETVVCRPTNVYERTKLAGERALLAYHRESGFPVVVVRPAWVYGPRCPRTEKLLRTVGRGRFIMFGDGKTLRHPVYIDDFLDGLQLAAQSAAAAGEIYFIAGDAAVSIRALVAAMAAAQGVAPPRLRLPLAAGTIAGAAAEMFFGLLGRRPPVSRRTMDFFRKDNAYLITKAREQLGYAPRVALEEGLRRTLKTMASSRPQPAG